MVPFRRCATLGSGMVKSTAVRLHIQSKHLMRCDKLPTFHADPAAESRVLGLVSKRVRVEQNIRSRRASGSNGVPEMPRLSISTTLNFRSGRR